MRALQISAYGNPSEVLRLAEIPETGAPGAGEVLIEDRACAIEQA